MKQYSSFAEYARESSQNLASLAVPVVGAVEKRFAVSIPIITIIGIQVRHVLLVYRIIYY